MQTSQWERMIAYEVIVKCRNSMISDKVKKLHKRLHRRPPEILSVTNTSEVGRISLWSAVRMSHPVTAFSDI